MFENTYFMFFFQISKKHACLLFFEMTYQKVVKSLNVYRNFGLNSRMLWGLIGVYHTHL